MVISGKGCPEQAPAARIAELTLRCFMTHVPAAVPGHRLPLRWAVGGRGDREPQRDQPGRRSVAAVVLVRAGAAGIGARDVGWRCRQHGGRAGCVHSPRAHERARGGRRMERRAGAAGRRVGASSPRPHVDCGRCRARSARGAPPRGAESARSRAQRCAALHPRRRRSGARRSTAARPTTRRAGSSSTDGASTRSARRVTSRMRRSRWRCGSTIPRSSTTAPAPSISRARRRPESTGCATSCSASSLPRSSRSPAGGTRSSGARSSPCSR